MRLTLPLATLLATALWSCHSGPHEDSSEAWYEVEPVAAPAQDTVADDTGDADSAPEQDTKGAVQAEVDLQGRRQEKRAFLVTSFLDRGDQMLDRADLSGALEAYSNALQVDPASDRARHSLRRVESMLGDDYAQAATAFDDEVSREVVRRAQARMSAEDASTSGDNALRAGDFDAAIADYRRAELILRWHPLIASDSLDEALVTGKLARAVELKEEARLAADDQARLDAEEAREARDREQAALYENKLQTLYSQANSAFLSEKYSTAEALCAQVIMLDSGNEAAMELTEVAAAARHAKADELHRRNFREQWQRTFDDLGTMNVPQVDSIVFDDLKRWREVSKRQPKSFKELDPLAREDKAVVLTRLGETVFTPNFGGPDDEGSPLEEIAAYLQSLTGVNFLISTRVTEDLDEEETSISLKLPERSVKNVLDIISETSESLRWKIEDGIVKFVTSEELLGGQVLRFYDVRDIIHPVPDFPGREINISPSGGLAEPDEDIEEREANVVTSDLLEGLIRNNISPESWELDEANNVQITETGALVVNQTPEVHEHIDQLLADLREATGIMVDVQARFLKVEDNFLEDIGIDFRGLGQPGLGSNASFNDFGDSSTQSELGDEIGQGTDLGAFFDDGLDGDVRTRVEHLYDMSLGDDNVLTGSGGLSFQWTYLNDLQLQLVMRAVSKSERIELVTAPHILVFNTARSSMSVLNQVTYVQDFDVEIAQAASIGDPMVAVIQDGVILDVRPVVSADRRFITIELRPTIATLKRPIREMVTTLGSQNSVTIQLPEVEIQRLRTSIPMPDGGTVLLGGWKVSEHSNQRSGVPLLSKIPILSALFERKGTYVSNRKLLILLKADIIIPAEHEPTEAQLGS
ncbi:MAG: hypothetical protein CMK00_01690 [Planctomycetes bacterium]|nr:hypothetical protein [Planctomycetota bacterium]